MTRVYDSIRAASREAVLLERFRDPAITAYNRLEARPRTEDFTRSLRAEVRDPLWFLTRQWQLGELQAEDAASPIDARLATRMAAFDRVALGKGPPQPYAHDVPLEVAVEQEAFPWTLPARIEAGRMFLRRLPAPLRGPMGTAALAAFPINAEPDWSKLADTLGLHRLAASRAIDGEQLLARHAAGTLAADLGAAGPDAAAVGTAADAVAAWRSRVFGDPKASPPVAWSPDRLGYDVSIATPDTGGQQAMLAATRWADGLMDWDAFDAAPRGQSLDDPEGAEAPAAPLAETLSFVPTAAAFMGMPAPRFWEMEDRRVSFGALNAKTTDHLLLVFAEMGLVYGNDWFVVPYEMPVNHLCQVLGLVVTDVFGDRTLIPPANGGGDAGWNNWNMFAVTGESSDAWPGSYFWIPAALTAVMDGDPVEELNLGRDEMANLAWGVEQTTPDELGQGAVTRLIVGDSAEAPPPGAPDLNVRYHLGVPVPQNWTPFLPVHLPGSVQDIRFQRGAMPPQAGGASSPRGVLLTELPAPYYIAEEDIPVSGVILTRRARRTRWYDGRTYLWIGRARETGRGAASSGLSFDQIDEKP
jgi:hypothetical protein